MSETLAGSVLPTLYKKTSTGAIQQWRVWSDGGSVYTEHGQVGGSLVTSEPTLCAPKNVGRSNATTAEQQAALEARSRWEKKAKSGYVPDLDGAEAGAVHDLVAGGVLPMLAHSYQKRSHTMRFPCAVQPKLDGHRCVAVVNGDGSVDLWSRTRKRITGTPHVARAIEALSLPPGTVLDGELYHHGYRDNFEELTSFIRQETPRRGHEVVEYHVYDMVLRDGFVDRWRRAATHLSAAPATGPLRVVETLVVADEAELIEKFGHFVAEGYEGAIARRIDLPYEHKRSDQLLKVKLMEDAEFEVVGVEEGRGRMAGLAIFACKTAAGEPFTVKMEGPLESLRPYWEDHSLAVGRMLTVRYQNMTQAGVPRFPVGVRFREDA